MKQKPLPSIELEDYLLRTFNQEYVNCLLEFTIKETLLKILPYHVRRFGQYHFCSNGDLIELYLIYMIHIKSVELGMKKFRGECIQTLISLVTKNNDLPSSKECLEILNYSQLITWIDGNWDIRYVKIKDHIRFLKNYSEAPRIMSNFEDNYYGF